METKRDFIWKMGGQQGQGVESCGEILGKVLAQEGYSLFSQRLFASRIKGGHTTIALRIATKEIATIGEHVDCLVALDQETIDIHGKEVPEGGVIIADDAFHPKFEAHTGRMFLALPITELAKKYGSMQMKNIAALGMSAGVLGFPEEPFYGFIADRFAKKGDEIISKNKAIFKDGYDTAIAAMHGVELGKLATPPKKDQLYLLGNEAAALGAISAGARFMASYPITPATEIMEYMIKVIHKIHGTVVQTEDELSSCMMAMGGGYAGVRAFTATSGPGLSLMAESISMAATAEIPVVIIDVMRAGPSTGMATKVEQSDIRYAIGSGHGDAEKIVLAAVLSKTATTSPRKPSTLLKSSRLRSSSFPTCSSACASSPSRPLIFTASGSSAASSSAKACRNLIRRRKNTSIVSKMWKTASPREPSRA